MGARLQRIRVREKEDYQTRQLRLISVVSAKFSPRSHKYRSKMSVEQNGRAEGMDCGVVSMDTTGESSAVEIRSGRPPRSVLSDDLVNRFSQGLTDYGTSKSDGDLSRGKFPVVFRWDGDGEEIYVSGSYDNWKTRTILVKSGSFSYTILNLPLGRHEYKFLVDGTWTVDQNLQTVCDNDCGTQNNVLITELKDYNVLNALQSDDFAGGGFPPMRWSQFIPPLTTGTGYLRRGPPSLPPFLINSPLNEMVSTHGEPNMLPEPNRVVLNHLYTLSIKDGVAVLSATSRYRRKYITMILYQPL